MGVFLVPALTLQICSRTGLLYCCLREKAPADTVLKKELVIIECSFERQRAVKFIGNDTLKRVLNVFLLDLTRSQVLKRRVFHRQIKIML